jgi:septal ring factor EnvC (AmiA/AmiB activator)
MLKQLWKFILEHIWPLVWPIIRDAIIEVVQDVLEWLKIRLRKFFRERADQQTQFAEQKAEDAQFGASAATNEADRVRLTAEAEAWKRVAAELESQNHSLQQQLDALLTEAAHYSAARVESEATKARAAERVLTLAPPEEAVDEHRKA